MEKKSVEATDPLVLKHIDVIQSIIGRMASSSSQCKTWCVTIVSAVFVLSYREDNTTILGLSFIPLILFFFLDAYYLSIEREMRCIYTDLITKLHKGVLSADRVFRIKRQTGMLQRIVQVLKVGISSASILPFYGFFVILLLSSRWFV